MSGYLSYLSAGAVLLSVLGSISNINFLAASAQVSTQQVFPDVPADYWARPFIVKLAQENIIAGYPDGTFRPTQSIHRDEFAAIVRKAFSQEQVREIQSASQFADVPENYWAEIPIEEAYETGFMSKTSEDSFSPQQPMTKLEAILALTNGLEMMYRRSTATTASNRPGIKNPLAFPLASTALIAPFIRSTTASASPTQPQTENASVIPPASEIVNQFYEDADRIPADAIDEVAIATRRGIVVNYPNQRQFNPEQPLERGMAAALIHQTLVEIDKLPPLETEVEASKYVVDYTIKE